MKKENKQYLSIGLCFLVFFAVWTVLVRFVDVDAIGPGNSTVGFAAVNHFVHNLTGVHMALYTFTDWLSLVPVLFIMGFALLGLIQWIKRKHIFRVDSSILTLGLFYIAVMAVYIFFENVVINYRPVLMNGVPEASYPSSTTMLVLCVMPTAGMQLGNRIKNNIWKQCILLSIAVFTVLMVVLRLVSGVHWFTDIVGGILISSGLVMLYRSFSA